MRADQCITSAHSSHSHAERLPSLVRPLSCHIRLSQYTFPVVALSKSSFLLATSFPLFLHHHATHSRLSARRHLKHHLHELVPCRYPSSARVAVLPAANHATPQAPFRHLLVLCPTAQGFSSPKYTQDRSACVQEACCARSTWCVQEAQARNQKHEPQLPRRQLASYRFH